ncbi:MAG: hypothetical protein ACK2VD_24320, partial [Anaerolineae bacterium]
MIVWLGTACFGAVLGWVCATVYRRGRPAWRELEVLIEKNLLPLHPFVARVDAGQLADVRQCPARPVRCQ